MSFNLIAKLTGEPEEGAAWGDMPSQKKQVLLPQKMWRATEAVRLMTEEELEKHLQNEAGLCQDFDCEDHHAPGECICAICERFEVNGHADEHEDHALCDDCGRCLDCEECEC